MASSYRHKPSISIGKQSLVFYAILGPVITLLLGIIIGIGVIEEPSLTSRSVAKVLFQEIRASRMKEDYQHVNSIAMSSDEDNAVANIIAEKWRTQLDKVEVLSYQGKGKTSNNIIGYLIGGMEKERFVILGNSRSAWNSGTPVILELVRSFGQLVKSGKWQPRRTIVFCSWGPDGDGVTEWVSAMEKTLFHRAVVYFDIDHVVQGNTSLSASGTPNLRKAVMKVAQDVENPNFAEINNGMFNIFETWRHNTPDTDRPSLPLFEFQNSENSNQIILFKGGVSYFSMAYRDVENGNPVTQTHKSRSNILELIDPEYRFVLANAQMLAQLTTEFANDAVLPFSPYEWFHTLNAMVSKLVEEYYTVFERHGISTEHLVKALERCGSAIITIEESIKNADNSNVALVRIINDKLSHFEQVFLDKTRLFDETQNYHTLFGMEDSYCPNCHELPGVRSAIRKAEQNGNWNEVAKQISILTFHIDAAAITLSGSW